jgi:hypothetical protein
MIAPACVEDPGGLFVLQNQALDDTCVAQANRDGLYRSRGVLDIALASRYFMHPLIENQLTSSLDVKIASASGGGAGDPADHRIEANLIALAGAEVSFQAPANITFGAQLSQGRLIPVSGSVVPLGLATTGLEVVSPEVGRVIRESLEFKSGRGEFDYNDGAIVPLLVGVRFTGTTAGGAEVGSNEFSFPLDICARCLLRYAPGTLYEDTEDAGLTCDFLQAPVIGEEEPQIAETGDDEVPCLLGQDEPVDCPLCRTLVPDDESADALCDPADPS